MQNSLVWLKIKERLNKLDSSDYDNIECWQVREAFNKAQIEWVRRQMRGKNQLQVGEEEDKVNVDDLQVLLKVSGLKGNNKDLYFETDNLPKDYLYIKRLVPVVNNEECGIRKLKSTLREEANVDEYLQDWSMQPSLDFEETFHTIIGNKIRIYTNGEFQIEKASLIYYRHPRELDFGNCEHIDGTPGKDIDPEFKNDIMEILIDKTAAILAGDIESPNQVPLNEQRSEINT